MELWIRSQDKRVLQKVDNVYLNANYDNRRICTIDSRDYESDLGEYKTKERALEVLDEIQNLLNPHTKLIGNKDFEGNDIKVYGVEYIRNYVYEMPKE